MSIIGVSYPYYAIYHNTGDSVTYSSGGELGRMTEVDVVINTSEDNNLFANNGIAETDRQFTDGTVTVGTDHLSPEVSKAILGVREEDLEEIPGVTDTGVKELIYDDSMANPYLGQGYVVKQQHRNKVSWRAVVFTKTMFNVPDESAVTQGEQIEWQTPSLVAAILRDDTPEHKWKRESTFTTEAQARAYIRHRLNITESAGGDTGTGGAEETQAARMSSKSSSKDIMS